MTSKTQSTIKRMHALAQKVQRRVRRFPRPPGCEKLAGADAWYRVRQGDYRVIYSVDDVDRIVQVVKIGHRREVYR
jgi:mRNA interferase RelE/StbE